MFRFIPSKYHAKIRYFLLMPLILYLTIEGIFALFVHTHYIPATKPSFSSDLFAQVSVADMNADWGRWHAFSKIQFQSECFDIEASCNSYGARDVERTKQADSNRVVVLGDSFVEGYGTIEADRLSNLLEDTLKKEVLNFGCSGIGHTHYAMIYKQLASQFSHNTVIVGMLPANDFMDSDQAIQASFYLDYRPYWKTNYPSCELTYSMEKVEDSPYYYKKMKTPKTILLKILRNYTYWYNVLYYFVFTKEMSQVMNYGTANSNTAYSGFYDYTNTQFSHLQCSLSTIKNLAGNKKIIVLLFPTLPDLARFHKEKEISKLGKDLLQFTNNQDITLIDLLPIWANQNPSEQKSAYLPCDYHLSRKGNEWAMKAILPYLRAGDR